MPGRDARLNAYLNIVRAPIEHLFACVHSFRVLRDCELKGEAIDAIVDILFGMIARKMRTTANLSDWVAPRAPPFVRGSHCVCDDASYQCNKQYNMSARGALPEVARNLYRVLRQADAGGHRQIQLEPLRGEAGGLAAAITDRMKRAAAKR